MTRTRRFLAAGIASLAVTASATAQAPFYGPGFGVGVGIGPGGQTQTWAGPAFGPGFGYGYPYYGRFGYPYSGFGGFAYPFFPFGYQGAAGSYYTNGLSLYGPPVPTNGPIPGQFGGSDAFWQLSNTRTYDPFLLGPNAALHGAAKDLPPLYLPPGYKGPRFATKDVKRRFDDLRYDPLPQVAKATLETDLYNARVGPQRYAPFGWWGPALTPALPRPADPTCVRLVVTVPTPDAQVWLDGQPTELTGTERVFETTGPAGSHQITAKWGPGTITTKTVTGKPGETVTVAFGE